MNALTIFIRRPVLATMVTVLLLVLGGFSLRGIGIDLMPKIEVPVVVVMTVLRGASPEEVESQVSKPIEEQINTIQGVDEMTSYNREGISIVVVMFKLERAADAAAQDVRDKVAIAQRNLPVGTDAPIVQRIEFDAFPVLKLAVSGDRDIKEVSEIARLKVKESLENVSGVGSVDLLGAQKRAINVILDVDRLKAYGIPIAQVKGALMAQNIEIPSGRIDRGEREEVLRTLARVETVEDFKKLVVAKRGGRQITIGDLGQVEDSIEEPRTRARVWMEGDEGSGAQSVSVNIVKQSGSNTMQVIKAVKQRLELIEKTLPAGFKISIISDQSIFIQKSIDELLLHLVLGGVLASLAVLLFMRNLRSTVIAAVAIPTSLIATFAVMKVMDFTLNNMTLLGLTLAVGIVIDDAIVVLENIFRHMEQYGKTAFQAAIDGLKEIGLAVMATTTSLIVIFLPIAFMEGMAGRYLYEFGMTVAFSVAVSLLIAFTLTPMLSARMLKLSKKQKAAIGKEHEYGWMEKAYGAVVSWALRHRWVVVVTAVLCLALMKPVMDRLGKDFMPMDDQSEFQVWLGMPGGTSLEASDAVFLKVEKELHKLKGITKTLTQVGSTTAGAEDVTTGTIYVALTPLEERKWTQKDKMREVREVLKNFPEVRSSVNFLTGLGGGRSSQFQSNLVGPDVNELTRLSAEVAKKLRQVPGMVDVDTSLAAVKPEVRVQLDRPKAADLGISATDIAMSLRTMVAGEPVSKFREGIEQYDVWLRLDKRDRSTAELIDVLPILSPSAGLVSLNQVARLADGQGPSEITRYNRQRMVAIYANYDGIDQGSAEAAMAKAMEELREEGKVATGYDTANTGRSKAMADTFRNMLLAFGLAFIFMYIVLAAQFESFLHPVTILLSLPLTLPFALVALLIMGDTLNLYSILGVFLLFGIVKKNGILQIDYTNTLYVGHGLSLKEAIVKANMARFRPILMTTVTLIAGMVPIALGQGPGAASRASLAKVIIGGQTLSLFITLLIVPVAYSAFEGVKKRFGFDKASFAQSEGGSS